MGKKGRKTKRQLREKMIDEMQKYQSKNPVMKQEII